MQKELARHLLSRSLCVRWLKKKMSGKNQVKRQQAYKFELRPNGEQLRMMRRFAGSCRFVFNKALALQKNRFEKSEKRLSYAGLCKELTGWKSQSDMGWLNEAHSQILQQSLKNLELAYKNFFEQRADFPKFKKKGLTDSFRFPQGCKIDQLNSRVYLPKLGWLRYRNSREILGLVKNITISFKNGKWFISAQTERDFEPPIHLSSSIVGADAGIKYFVTLSDGMQISSINAFKNLSTKLAHAQRGMSRKKKFSKNWIKAKQKVANIHARISNVRHDFLHKTSATISKNHAIIVIEDLRVSNMSKSVSGSIEKPGKGVKQKTGLNQSILDQGWAEFRRQLEYKQAWMGGSVIAINPRNTSRLCPACGHISADNRQTQGLFECVECGFASDADINAACNILAAGHAVLACGETAQSGRSVKQEPTEATKRELISV